MVSLEKINYQGWPNSYRLANARVDLIVTTDVGPRIIRFGFIGQGNEFKVYPDQMGKKGGDEWRIYGGHRLWHSPESKPRTYFPDNGPVTLEKHPGFIRLIQPVEATTGIQKEMDIALDAEDSHVRIIHRLRNANLWTVSLAPWALSVMEAGGTAILPLPARKTHEQNISPANSVTLWTYTDLTDPRWTWGKRCILLKQDSSREAPQKIGLMAPDGWVAYARNDHLFIKRTAYQWGSVYPDYGSSMEIFANSEMMEVETLGPFTALEPNHQVEHQEDWYLFSGVQVPQNDQEVDGLILPRLAQAESLIFHSLR